MPNLDFFNSQDCQVAMLSWSERFLLYSLVRGLEPQRLLEIGFASGGSSRIMLAALDANHGAEQRLVSIDPQPHAAPAWTGDSRFTLLREPSPQAIPHAIEVLGGPVDFCFIDANHAESYVYADSCGAADVVAHDGYILYHDAFYPDVQRAVDRFLKDRGDFVDCGLISRFRSKAPTPWGGFRLLRRAAPCDLGAFHPLTVPI